MENTTEEAKGTPAQEAPKSETTQNNKLSVPMAIVIAGALVAGAVYFSSVKTQDKAQSDKQLNTGSTSLENMRAVSEADHVRGNPDAPIKIVEYSDPECPFCKTFHATMRQVMDEYGKEGKVAWVYRHFPIDSIHPKARKEAEALECANDIGGPEKFWMYLDRLFEITPSNNGLDPAELPKIAEYAGLDVAKFNTCLKSGRHAERIEQDLENAAATGGRGTPWSIVIARDGKKYPINGAQPYEVMKQAIDFALE